MDMVLVRVTVPGRTIDGSIERELLVDRRDLADAGRWQVEMEALRVALLKAEEG